MSFSQVTSLSSPVAKPKITFPFKLQTGTHSHAGGVEQDLMGLLEHQVNKFNPSEEILVKLDHFPRDRGENNKCLKPPPSLFFFEGVHLNGNLGGPHPQCHENPKK